MSQHKATTQYVALALQQCSVAPARLAKGEGAPHWYLVVGNRSWPNHQFILYCQTKKTQKKKKNVHHEWKNQRLIGLAVISFDSCELCMHSRRFTQALLVSVSLCVYVCVCHIFLQQQYTFKTIQLECAYTEQLYFI